MGASFCNKVRIYNTAKAIIPHRGQDVLQLTLFSCTSAHSTSTIKTFTFMKKLQIFATVTNINGRKSSGVEDYSGYQHWRVLSTNSGSVLD